MRDTINRVRWFESVVERYEGPLLRYAFRILGDLDRARDVVQDIFIRLWKVEPEEVKDRLAAWLFMVCRNRALDVQRKEDRMKPIDAGIFDHTENTHYTPDQAAEANEAACSIFKLLSTLPAQQQEVIRLKFQNGLSYQEISQVTRLTVSNVGYLIHTAIKSLREKMQTAK